MKLEKQDDVFRALRNVNYKAAHRQSCLVKTADSEAKLCSGIIMSLPLFNKGTQRYFIMSRSFLASDPTCKFNLYVITWNQGVFNVSLFAKNKFGIIRIPQASEILGVIAVKTESSLPAFVPPVFYSNVHYVGIFRFLKPTDTKHTLLFETKRNDTKALSMLDENASKRAGKVSTFIKSNEVDWLTYLPDFNHSKNLLVPFPALNIVSYEWRALTIDASSVVRKFPRIIDEQFIRLMSYLLTISYTMFRTIFQTQINHYTEVQIHDILYFLIEDPTESALLKLDLVRILNSCSFE